MPRRHPWTSCGKSFLLCLVREVHPRSKVHPHSHGKGCRGIFPGRCDRPNIISLLEWGKPPYPYHRVPETLRPVGLTQNQVSCIIVVQSPCFEHPQLFVDVTAGIVSVTRSICPAIDRNTAQAAGYTILATRDTNCEYTKGIVNMNISFHCSSSCTPISLATLKTAPTPMTGSLDVPGEPGLNGALGVFRGAVPPDYGAGGVPRKVRVRGA